eukprot:Skav207837  [mRNA]  locus=scaffold2005:101101:114213:- [translate_table: standard]
MQPRRQRSAIATLGAVGDGTRFAVGVTEGAGRNLVIEVSSDRCLGRFLEVVQGDQWTTALGRTASSDVQQETFTDALALAVLGRKPHRHDATITFARRAVEGPRGRIEDQPLRQLRSIR